MQIDNLLTDQAVLAELGRRLASARIERRMTQADLAVAAGVSKRTVERLEDGASAQLDSLLRCLRALGRLEAFDALLPAAAANPIALLERRGAAPSRVRARRRGAHPGGEAGGPPRPWTWGDE